MFDHKVSEFFWYFKEDEDKTEKNDESASDHDVRSFVLISVERIVRGLISHTIVASLLGSGFLLASCSALLAVG